MCIKGNKNYPGRKIVILTLITLRRVVILQTFNTLWSVPLTVQTDSASTGIGLPLHDVHLRCETAVLTPARTLRLTQLRKSTAAPCGGGRALNKRGRRGPAPRSTQSPAARRSRRGEEEEGRRPAARHEARARPHGGGAPRGERSGPSPDTGRGRRAHTGARTPPPFSEAARARALQAGGGGGEGTAPRAEKGGAKGGGRAAASLPFASLRGCCVPARGPGCAEEGTGRGAAAPEGKQRRKAPGTASAARIPPPASLQPPAEGGNGAGRGMGYSLVLLCSEDGGQILRHLPPPARRTARRRPHTSQSRRRKRLSSAPAKAGGGAPPPYAHARGAITA